MVKGGGVVSESERETNQVGFGEKGQRGESDMRLESRAEEFIKNSEVLLDLGVVRKISVQ